MLRGHLRTVVLTVLEEKDMSGSEIVSMLEKDFGWKPSPGSIYPILNAIEEEGLAKVRCVDDTCNMKKDSKKIDSNKKVSSAHKKIYSITSKGKSELKLKKKERNELADEIVKVHKMMASIYDVDTKKVEVLTENLKKGKVPFMQIHKETEALNAELFRLMTENKLDKNKNKVKKIINIAISDLKKIK